jgi:hypothetical protein
LAQEAEALRIVAEAALALISVTVPTYAISASFLGKETARTMTQIQQKRQETERRIASEAKNIEEMQAAIRRYTLEEQNLKDRLKRISVVGVVGYPSIFYGIALLLALDRGRRAVNKSDVERVLGLMNWINFDEKPIA